MPEFSITTLSQGAIQYLYAIRETIWLDPPYQRMSDIWPLDKRQLLIDSVLNGFDIPKLYFHELVPTRKVGKTFQKYAIIDGKQRLESLWSFMNGDFTLSNDFEYQYDSSVQLAGCTYRDIGEKYPLVKSRFDGTSLTVVAVRTDDTELVDEMFSRLNEAVPLNAPEKRNAFGGPLPNTIRDLANHRFFTQCLPFSDRRYKHRDLAAKYLMIEDHNDITDTKKAYLDHFVKTWAADHRTALEANNLKDATEIHLERMCDIFTTNDTLLRSVGMTLLMFHLFRLLDKSNQITHVRREHFLNFEQARKENRELAEQDITKARYDLLEFDKYVQTPNDAYATRLRLKIMATFLKKEGIGDIPLDHGYLDGAA